MSHKLLYYVRCSPAYGVPARPTCLFCALARMVVAGDDLPFKKRGRMSVFLSSQISMKRRSAYEVLFCKPE